MDAAGLLIADTNSPSVLDPACGGGSFLVPAARRLAAERITRGFPPQCAAAGALRQIRGIELDPGLAELSRKLLLDALRREYGLKSGPARAVVNVGDALICDIPRRFDLIIGNPPYGRVNGRAGPAALSRAGRANLGGHTNLYSLFLLRALDFVKPGGGLVFVLPTSFVAGPYFSGLRQEILDRADVLRIDLHEQRDNLFVDAVQDVCLLSLRRRSATVPHRDVSFYHLGIIDAAGVHAPMGTGAAAPDGEPWALPVRGCPAASALPTRSAAPDQRVFVLADYGYRTRVGKVVPTRERERLRQRRNRTSLPLVWASDIRPDGSFLFASGRKFGNALWYDPPSIPVAYSTVRPAVAVQRTSNRDQRRRLNAAAISLDFLRQHRTYGFVAENHVIVLEATSAKPSVSPRKLAALLNSDPINERFATVAGSFSVSATLLARLALPDPKTLPNARRRNFGALLRASFAGVPLVLSPLQPARDPQHAGDKAGDMVGGGAADEDTSFERRAVA
jgi:adenine-specific DNA-methyltransferase